MNTTFWKVHALENDFPLFDTKLSGEIPTWDGINLSPEIARELCDRRRGIGGDGLIVVDRSQATARMVMYNPDGTRAEMCGNGLRCVAKHVAEVSGGRPSEVAIATDAGVKRCRLEWSDDVVIAVEVDMGPPIFDRAKIPVSGDGTNRGIAISANGRRFLTTAVSMGNPHAVIAVDEAPMPLAERYGPAIEVDALFPRKVNVEFVRPLGGTRFETAVWERGAGITRACGSGACATGAALCLDGRAPLGTPLTIALPGGELAITVEQGFRNVRMRGPAIVVFKGRLSGSAAVAGREP